MINAELILFPLDADAAYSFNYHQEGYSWRINIPATANPWGQRI
jgi:hypothetical protein